MLVAEWILAQLLVGTDPRSTRVLGKNFGATGVQLSLLIRAQAGIKPGMNPLSLPPASPRNQPTHCAAA